MSLLVINISSTDPAFATVWTINFADSGMATNEQIQDIIDNAEAGDTLLFTGTQYTHIHLSINKPLNIISNVGTQLYACPMEFPVGSDNLTVFSIHNGASGTNVTGFKINNNNEGYGININNTSQINVKNNIISCKNGTGINIISSDSINVNNNTLTNSNSGIKISNSNLTTIIDNSILNNNENGILFGEDVSNTLIQHNNISSNKQVGINLLESCDNVNITGNSITFNQNEGKGSGVHINTTISGLNITSNFIYMNGETGILYYTGVPDLQETTATVDSNYITGHTFRDVIRLVYDEEQQDVVRKEVWLNETCFGGMKRLCPSAHIAGEAIMSNITQVTSGIYNISFIDKDTHLTANDLGSFYVTFFLNKNDTSKGTADAGDIWKEILVQNGVATVDFTNATYKTSNNTIFVVAPYISFNSALKDEFKVSDSDIPFSKINLSASSSVSKSSLKNGDTIIYRVTIKNNNIKDATGVKVSNILSSTYFSSSAKPPRGSYSSGVWNVGTLKAGETLTLSVTARAKKSGVTKSQAKITGTNTNTLYSNSIQRTINKHIKLSYKNYVNSSKVKKYKYAYLTTKIKNSGKDRSNTVKIKISLPKSMKLVKVGNSHVYNKKTNTWTFTIPAGKTYSFTVKAKTTSRGTKKIQFNVNGKKSYKYVKVY
jgi:uncharacterized repeat protein (TIGR01451 family)